MSDNLRQRRTRKRLRPFSGNIPEAETSTKARADNLTISLCKESVAGINSIIYAENEDFKEAPNIHLKGSLGALSVKHKITLPRQLTQQGFFTPYFSFPPFFSSRLPP